MSMFTSVLPVVVINLGEFTKTVPNGKDKNGKAIFKDVTKYRYAIFLRQAKDTVFLLDSEGDNDPLVPSFKDCVKLDKISLSDSTDWKQSINTSMIMKLTAFLSDPLANIDNVSPYRLYTDGFLSEKLFKQILIGYLKIGALSHGLTIDDINIAEVMPLVARGAVNKTELSQSDKTLGDYVKTYLVAKENEFKALKNAKTQTPQPSTRSGKKIDQTPEPAKLNAKEFYANVDFSKQNKIGLIEACKAFDIPYSKKTTKQLIDLLTEEQTKPDSTPVSATVA